MSPLTSPRDPQAVGMFVGKPYMEIHRPPPPRMLVSIEHLLATYNELMSVLVQNEARRGAERLQHHRHQDMNTCYSDFLATHPPIFSGAKDPLEADDWLCTTK
jgi:hypothetical protein